jgi:hypothetical protein
VTLGTPTPPELPPKLPEVPPPGTAGEAAVKSKRKLIDDMGMKLGDITNQKILSERAMDIFQ